VWWNQDDFQNYFHDDDSMNDNWKDAANWVRTGEANPADIETGVVQQYSDADVVGHD
jgi:hypothetical protein